MSKNKINMNANGDSVVSFVPMDLTILDATGKYVLVTTDKDRCILFPIERSEQVRNFYGLKNDIFSNPRSVFSLCGKYVYSTSQTRK